MTATVLQKVFLSFVVKFLFNTESRMKNKYPLLDS